MDMGEALVVPVSAIMLTGKRNIACLVVKANSAQLGIRRKFGDVYAVKSGLKRTRGSKRELLIDAESKIRER